MKSIEEIKLQLKTLFQSDSEDVKSYLAEMARHEGSFWKGTAMLFFEDIKLMVIIEDILKQGGEDGYKDIIFAEDSPGINGALLVERNVPTVFEENCHLSADINGSLIRFYVPEIEFVFNDDYELQKKEVEPRIGICFDIVKSEVSTYGNVDKGKAMKQISFHVGREKVCEGVESLFRQMDKNPNTDPDFVKAAHESGLSKVKDICHSMSEPNYADYLWKLINLLYSYVVYPQVKVFSRDERLWSLYFGWLLNSPGQEYFEKKVLSHLKQGDTPEEVLGLDPRWSKHVLAHKAKSYQDFDKINYGMSQLSEYLDICSSDEGDKISELINLRDGFDALSAGKIIHMAKAGVNLYDLHAYFCKVKKSQGLSMGKSLAVFFSWWKMEEILTGQRTQKLPDYLRVSSDIAESNMDELIAKYKTGDYFDEAVGRILNQRSELFGEYGNLVASSFYDNKSINEVVRRVRSTIHLGDEFICFTRTPNASGTKDKRVYTVQLTGNCIADINPKLPDSLKPSLQEFCTKNNIVTARRFIRI